MGWKQQWRSYFTFNRRERKGILTLIVLILLVWSIRWTLENSASPDYKVEVNLLPMGGEDSTTAQTASFSPESTSTDLSSVQWEAFDPNSLSKEGFESFGLSPMLAKRILRYREKGGRFQTPEDLSVIYGMDEHWLDEASPFVRIAQNRTQENTEAKNKIQSVKIDLNRADTHALKSVPGIGSYYANAIIKLRDRLGGFRSYEQLMDIYQIRDEALTSLYENTFIDTNALQRIPLNSASLEQLGSHPYLTWKQAKVIVAYRQQHGPYPSLVEIKRTQVISDSVYRNIAPYLSLE